MKKFYLLPLRVSLLWCVLLSSSIVLGQNRTEAAELIKIPTRIDANRLSNKSPQDQKSVELKKGIKTFAVSPRTKILRTAADISQNPNAKYLKNSDAIIKSGSDSTFGLNVSAKDQKSEERSTKTHTQNFPNLQPQYSEDTANNQVSLLEKMRGKVEEVSLRDATSKHYKNGDGSYTALVATAPLHYEKNGKWENIDTKITRITSGEYSYSNTANLMESYFGGSAHQGILSKTKEGEIKEFLNTRMYWEVNGQEVGTIQSSNSAIAVKGDKAYYNNLYGNISVAFSTLTGKRKLEYIIPNKKAISDIPKDAEFLVFAEDVILPSGWAHTITENGIHIKDRFGKVVILYESPISTDENIESIREKNTIYETELEGRILHIKTKVKASWLLDSSRKYPVKVDPTVSAISNGGRSVASDGFQDTLGYFGAISGYFTQYHIKFNLSAIPPGSTVNSTTGFFYEYGVGGTTNAGNQWQWNVSADPTTTTGTALYTSANTGLSNVTAISNAAVWRSAAFLNGAPLTYVANGITAGSMSATIRPAGTYNANNFYAARTHNDANFQPYLVITYTIPACAVPTNLNVDTITSTSARFTWSAASPAPAQGYDYYYNTNGVAPTGGPAGTVGVGILTATQGSLNPNTGYHFWIRSKCSGTTSVSSWVYGGYFNTNPAQNCFQGDGQIRGTVEDGLGVQITDTYRVADDFIVPAGTSIDLSHISLEAISSTAITNVTINIRANNGGSPGVILNTVWNNTAPTLSTLYTTAFSLNVYHMNFTLPTSIAYPAGTYWVEVTMRNSNNTVVYWRSTSTGSTGAICQNSNNSGASWTPNIDGYDMVFYVAGACATCAPVSADSKIICAGQTASLSVNSPATGYIYKWYTNWDELTQTGTLIGTGPNINVAPAQSIVYRVVGQSGACSGYALVTVAISPGPSIVVVTPISAITCSNEVAKLDVTGGNIPMTVLAEDFTPLTHSWTTSTTTYGGAGPLYAAWAIYTNGTNNFAMADSDAYGAYQIETSLISEPMSFQDYSTVTLEFDHYFRQYLAASTGYVEISKNGGSTWSNIATFTTNRGTSFTNWQTESYNLSSYAGEAFIQIRFRYFANNAWYWAVNAVRITGTPLSTTVTWSPTTGLFTNPAGTIPYTGGNTTTVYASPSTTTTYTASAKTAVGCPANTTVVVERGDKVWGGGNVNWNTPSNWSESTIPTANHCVNIPSTAQKPIISLATNAFAKNLTIQAGAGLTIDGSLTVTEYVNNMAATADVVISSDASLKQISDSPVPANSGSVTAKRDIKLSGGRQQYNYVMSPLENQSLASIYKDINGNPVPVPFVLYHNESTNRFYNSTGAYIKGRGLAVKEPAAGFSPNTMMATFAGKPTNGAFTYGIVNSNLSDLTKGYNLTGNPYPSNIDLRKLYDINGGNTDPTQVTSSNISATFYFWDNNGNTIFEQQGSGYLGQSYALFNVLTGSNGTGTKASSGTKVPTKIVKVGQGFMTKSLVSSYSLNYNNSIRTSETSNIDFLGKENLVQDDRYWLKMTASSGIASTIAVVYYPGGNNLFGAEDSRSMGGSDAVYSVVENEDIGIDGRSTFSDTDRIALGTQHFASGNYIFALENKEGIFANGQNIYLKDLQTGIITNLSAGVYPFLANEGERTGRFEIIYRPETVLATESLSAEQTVVYRIATDVVIKSPKTIAQIEVYDSSGKLWKQVNPNQKISTIDVSMVPHGIYILKITNKEGQVVTRKFIR